MNRTIRWGGALMLALVAASGCAGAGGGGDGGDGSWLALSPRSISGTAYVHEVAHASLQASTTRTFTQAIYLVVVDSAGVLGSFDAWAVSDTTVELSFGTSRAIAAGTHEGELLLYLCYDSSCSQPLDGAPWHIPYRFEIVGYDLRALSTTPGAGPWSTSGGDAAHDGYVPGTFDASRIGRRWWFDPTPGQPNTMSPVSVDEGRVFMTTNPKESYPQIHPSKVWAFSEDTGEVLWSFERVSGLSAPAAANGRVYVAGYSELLVLDAATGALVRAATIPGVTQTLDQSVPPTPAGDAVFVGYGDSGYFGDVGIAKFDAVTGAHLWTLAGSSSWENTVPVVSEGLLFTGDVHVLNATFASDGTHAWSYTNAAVDGWRYGIVASDGVVCTFGGEACLDTGTQTPTAFSGAASGGIRAIANGIAYQSFKYDDTTLDARSIGDGALRWSWTSEGELAEQVVVTDNLAFVRLAYSTVAVDLATREVVWSIPVSGSLALSSRGVLYLVDQMNNIEAPRLMAFNLR